MSEKEVIFKMDEEKKKKMHLTIIREGSTWKEVMNDLADEWLKKHGDSNNPQSQITSYVKEEIMAIPNLYEEDPKVWQKFFSHSNFDMEEYKLLEKQHTMFTGLMNRKHRELEAREK